MGSCRLGFGRGIRGAILCLLLALLVSRAAHANNVVLLEPRFDGPMLPAEQAKLKAAAEEALREQHFQIVPTQDVESAIVGEPNLRGCNTEPCWERLGRVLDSQLVVRYRVKVAVPSGKNNGDWRMAVDVLDVEVGAMGARLVEDRPELSGQKAAEHLLDMIRRAILQTAGRPRATLNVLSQPPGAAVFVDGNELGITPYKRPSFAGPHKLVLRHLGYRSEQRELTVEESKDQRIEVTLQAGSDPTTPIVEKAPVYKKWWFWVAIGGAAVAVAAITAGVVVGTRQPSERTLPENSLIFNF